MMATDTERARAALQAIPPDCDRDTWVRAGMAAHAAGLDFDAFDSWSAQADNYDARAARDTWRSFKAGKGVGAGTLHRMAAEHGHQQERPAKAIKRAAAPPPAPRPGMAPADVWARCEPATNAHAYIERKAAQGVPLDGLRVVPAGDALRIGGNSMAGALAVPAYAADGTLQSLQLIPPQGKKMNLPGAPMAGASFTVGTPDAGPLYLVEGIGQAWACWQATGRPAVCCFGWGNVGTVAKQLHQRDASARLVLVPDVGKEPQAESIARELGCSVAAMPEGEPQNFDCNDLAQRDGADVLAALLESATAPEPEPPRYRLLTGADLHAMPPLAWRIRGVLPAQGLAALYGPSTSGKSFLAFDMAAAIAQGRDWFAHRVTPAPVVYLALEGEGGFKGRTKAWELVNHGELPAGLHLVLQPFNLTEPQDVADLAAVVPAGAVVIVDTLNRAAPLADENASKDMGEILQAAKRLQSLTAGLVLLVHHSGKDATRGLRGHSSLFAAMDAAIEVARDGDRREWKVAKAKDGEDGKAHPFRLAVQPLGTDSDGEEITSCVVQPDTTAQAVRAVKLPQGGNQRIAFDALRPVFKADGRTGINGAPPLRLCLELEAAITAAAGALPVANDRKAERARAAITGLIARGVLVHQEGWIWQS